MRSFANVTVIKSFSVPRSSYFENLSDVTAHSPCKMATASSSALRAAKGIRAAKIVATKAIERFMVGLREKIMPELHCGHGVELAQHFCNVVCDTAADLLKWQVASALLFARF